MLYLVGLGLSDETDITVKGLEVVKKAERVYLEAYTSILLVDQATLVRWRPSFIVVLVIFLVSPLFLPACLFLDSNSFQTTSTHEPMSMLTTLLLQ